MRKKYGGDPDKYKQHYEEKRFWSDTWTQVYIGLSALQARYEHMTEVNENFIFNTNKRIPNTMQTISRYLSHQNNLTGKTNNIEDTQSSRLKNLRAASEMEGNRIWDRTSKRCEIRYLKIVITSTTELKIS